MPVKGPFGGGCSVAQPLHDLATTARLRKTATRLEKPAGRGDDSGISRDDRLFGHLDGCDGIGQLAGGRGAPVTGGTLEGGGPFALHQGGPM